ncbi:hypothetical protein LOTGIDRAFT_161924 [Lottia gigantea]|uniref:Uncharacterized protein n=1 Tax=Lottia gigantea TaxID=225164 RepID=V4BWJ4_LOTGI|nr:hypothetical protein LOTGIDRAFT_161924 [Lottia gigantea]ESO93359.1 hypothetical protein LOTGIDRAFT_161924 [Lottia gigantea]
MKYQTLEKEHLDTLKTTTYDAKIDVIAKAKRLSHETNRRRKAQALKRKKDAQSEEKRRQEILAKRHEEQKIATERFQRSHISHSRPTSSRIYKYSSSTGIDDALRLVRGSPSVSRQNSYVYHGGRTSPLPAGNYPSDPLNRPYVNSHKTRHNRPVSPTSPQSREHNELMDKSLRNWNDSRSLFEQQLEQHQQLLLDQQQKSLYEFNEAISNEIASDRKVNGIEDEEDKSLSRIKNSESFSSVDSLEDSLNFKNKKHLNETYTSDSRNDIDLLAHNLIYPISASSGAKDSFYLESRHDKDYEKPQQINQSYSDIPKQTHPYRPTVSTIPHCTSMIPTVPHSSSISTAVLESNAKPMFVLNGQFLQANVPPDTTVQEMDRPTSNVKTWVEPEKAESVPNKSNINNRVSTASTYDIAPTPQVKPRTIFTSNSNNTTSNTITTPNSYNTGSTSVKYSSNSHGTYVDIQKPDIVAFDHGSSGLRYNADSQIASTVSVTPQNTGTSGLRYETGSIPETVNTNSVSNSKYKSGNTSAKTAADVSNKTSASKPVNGSILSGTLHLVNGQLVTGTSTFIATSSPVDKPKVSKFPGSYVQVEETPPIIERSESKENIVGILKKSPSLNSFKNFESRDSLEIIKLKRQSSEDSCKRPKSGKKSVRFADLSDEEEPDSLLSSFSSDTIKKINLKGAKGKSRPSSARIVSKMSKVPPSAPKPPRASSAGTIRSGSKPKAAAHIITHDPFQTQQSEEYYKNLQSHLENKVTVVNSKFLVKIESSKNNPAEVNGNNSVHTVTSKPPIQLKMTHASKHVPTATNSTSPPQHARPSTNGNLPVYDENGLRIDRTPTDDEINQLWETMKSCLHPDGDDKSLASHVESDLALVTRQKAPLSSTVIDGGLLGSVGQPTRIVSACQRPSSKAYQGRQVPQAQPNGYLQKYGLLQQRRQQDKSANNHQPPVKNGNFMPQVSPSNAPPTKKEDLGLSLFLSTINHPQTQTITISNTSQVGLSLFLSTINHPQTQTITISNTSQSPGFRGRRPITAHQRRHTDGVARDYLIRAASVHCTSQQQYR